MFTSFALFPFLDARHRCFVLMNMTLNVAHNSDLGLLAHLHDCLPEYFCACGQLVVNLLE